MGTFVASIINDLSKTLGVRERTDLFDGTNVVSCEIALQPHSVKQKGIVQQIGTQEEIETTLASVKD